MTTFKIRRRLMVSLSAVLLLVLPGLPAAGAPTPPVPASMTSATAGAGAAQPDDLITCGLGPKLPYLQGGFLVTGKATSLCEPHLPEYWAGWFKVWRKRTGYSNVLVMYMTIPEPASPNVIYTTTDATENCQAGWTYWLHAYVEFFYDNWATLDGNSANVRLC